MPRPLRKLTRSEQIAKMPDEFIWCRATRHLWETTFAYGARDPATDQFHRNWARMHEECPRCGMSVTRVYDQYFKGLPALTAYRRPKGYDVTGRGYGHWKSEAREELFIRQLGTPDNPKVKEE